MLKELTVSNFAIIENINIKFKEGLTVLTGETGAGKSLIIDSLSLLLGDRASSEMIRTGYDKAEITGVFEIRNNVFLNALLDNLNIPYQDSILSVYRSVSQSKSQIKVNGTSITLSDLKKISKYLADIHMQFDTGKLFNPENYLDIVDGFKYDLIKEYTSKYTESLIDFKNKRSEYLDILKKAKDIKEKKDIYEYHLKEIESMDLKITEEDEINSRIDVLKNYDKVYALLEETDSLIREDFLDKLYEVKEKCEELTRYSKDFIEKRDKLNDYYYEIDSIFGDIKKEFKNLDYDPKELENLEERLNDIDNLKRKYKMNVKELLEYKDSLVELLKIDESFDDIINDLKTSLKEKYDRTYSLALELSKVREGISKSIEKELERNMNDLELKARFSVTLNISKKEDDLSGSIFKDSGIDEVDFLIETNIGEGLKPLSKTVSGGEASRIMLALKALYIKSQKIQTVIFDEIDTGISGEVAKKVGDKIHEISLSTQVISITHLPQVASRSRNHLKISKTVKDGRTYTKVNELSLDEKIIEVAKMISGDKLTESQIQYAKELILS